MTRQFTDGEIIAAIKRIVAEGATLSREAVRKHLGGGGSSRISAILKNYRDGMHGAPSDQAKTLVQTTVPVNFNTASSESISSRPTLMPTLAIDRQTDRRIAQLQSEIRVLKILLESERNARRNEEARYCQTIEALQREVETAGQGQSSYSPEKK